MTAGEISNHFNMSKPAISKHLDILKEAELISFEKKGQFLIYSINVSVLQEALGGFLEIFSKKQEGNMDKLGTILFIIFLGYTYIKAPEISGLSKDNPKIKTVRRM